MKDLNSCNKEDGYSLAVYQDAVAYFNKDFQEPGFTIENDYVKEHKEELCYCYEQKKTLLDFDWWCRYEDLLNTRISYKEYCVLDQSIDDDPMDISPEDTKTIKALQKQLHIVRGDYIEMNAQEESNLDTMIQSAEEKTVHKTMTEDALYQAVYDKFAESNKIFEEELSRLSFEEMKPYLSEYLLRTELLRVLEENIASRELNMTDCYALFYSTFSLASIVEKFHELKHVEELDKEYRLDILNAFEECAQNRINAFAEIAKNVKERS